MESVAPFRWQDGERTIRFGQGAVADGAEDFGEGYALLTTERTLATAPQLADRASQVVHVRSGRVDEIAGELLDEVGAHGLLVALGGGRVIDTAKAIASARGAGTGVAAIPTTLSAAEMTAVHRRAAGAPQDTPGVRPRIVLNDPALTASQPEGELAASAANALAHAVEGPATTLASPVPAFAGREAARLIAGAWDGGEPDRPALALGALLSGWTIDSTWYGLHHVASQTLVRLAGIGHGQANAALLPHTIGALHRRAPDRVDPAMAAVAAELARRAGATSLQALGVEEDELTEFAEAAAQRPELGLTPPPADAGELRALYTSAF